MTPLFYSIDDDGYDAEKDIKFVLQDTIVNETKTFFLIKSQTYSSLFVCLLSVSMKKFESRRNAYDYDENSQRSSINDVMAFGRSIL